MGVDEIIVPGCGDAVVPGEDRRMTTATPIPFKAQLSATLQITCHVVQRLRIAFLSFPLRFLERRHLLDCKQSTKFKWLKR
jgi:hypothetical protein